MNGIFLILLEDDNMTVGELAKKAEKELPIKWQEYEKVRDEKGIDHPDTDKAGASYTRTKKIVDLKLPKSSKKTIGELKKVAQSVIQRRKDEQYDTYKVAPKGSDGFTQKGTPERKKWEGKTARVFRAENIAGIKEDMGAAGAIDTSVGVFGQTPNPLAGKGSKTKVSPKKDSKKETEEQEVRIGVQKMNEALPTSSKGSQKSASYKYKFKKNGTFAKKEQEHINEDINMKEIVKVLLQEGIDEETIHEVLGILEAEIPDFVQDAQRRRENAEIFAQTKAEQAKREEKEKNDTINDIKAQIYSARALSNLKKNVRGKRSLGPQLN